MFTDNHGDLTLTGGLSITFIILIFLAGLIVLGMWGCPQYDVYSARKEGQAILAHAQSSREVAVAEAKAKMEAAALLAQADTIRAHGIAESNEIIGKSLENNPSYLRWLWIDQIKDTKNQIIYLPNNGQLPFTEATRLGSK
jgi:regulator of protease activity HflC (stomatin/prohibitin superfamily)